MKISTDQRGLIIDHRTGTLYRLNGDYLPLGWKNWRAAGR